MNLDEFIRQALELTSTLDPRTASALFLLCLIGEAGVSIPYVLESVWLMAGYHLGSHVLPPLSLLGLWLAAQLGRQGGAYIMASLSRIGSIPLKKVYRRFFNGGTNGINYNRLKWFNFKLLTPLSTAMGRLYGLRIPLSITLGLRKEQRVLSLGILISSLIWDTVYILLGVTVGATAALSPIQMMLASFIGLTLFYLATLLARTIYRKIKNKDKLVPEAD